MGKDHFLKSRKTWATIASVASLVAGALSGEITWSTAIIGIAGALSIFTAATGVGKIGENASIVASVIEALAGKKDGTRTKAP